MVYLQHGIAVGMMMTAASLMGLWLWWTGSLKYLWGLPIWLPLGAVLFTTVAVKSIGAVLLLGVGFGMLVATRYVKTYVVVIAVVALPCIYMSARALGGWDGQFVVNAIESNIERDRAASLQCRFDNERLLLDKAMKKPLFGWGPHGANLVIREDGTIESIPDGLWVIAIGSNGIVGLVALYGALLLPVWLIRRRMRPMAWGDPMLAGVTAFAVLITLHSIDNLLNAMVNPIFLVGLGALAGVVAAPRVARRAPTPQRGFQVGAPQEYRRPIPV